MLAKSLEAEINEAGLSLGFDGVGICDAEAIEHAAPRLREFVGAGFYGDMAWMADTLERRSSPLRLWQQARTAIVVTMNYGPECDPLDALKRKSHAAIAAYAKGRDYHDVLKGRLKQLAQTVAKKTGKDLKVFVDTAPLMEKPLAQAAGLGWQGKHTNLVSTQFGSWLFLGAILTSAELRPDTQEVDHCGTCRRCLDVCPTNAFPAPYRLDARRCISYLTIEHKGHIAHEFRKPMGNRIFGCDDCLAVCPWNKFASRAREPRFWPKEMVDNPPLADLLKLGDEAFRSMFAGTPIKRTGRDRFVRNVLIAAGNSGDPTLIPDTQRLLADPSPLVRAMAVWALGELLDGDIFAKLRAKHECSEADQDVRAEWHREVIECAI